MFFSAVVGVLPCTQSMLLSSKLIYFLFLSHFTLQGPEHPNPGKSFTARGFPRHCYLPDSEKGRKVRGAHRGGLSWQKCPQGCIEGEREGSSSLGHGEKQTWLTQPNPDGGLLGLTWMISTP